VVKKIIKKLAHKPTGMTGYE